MTNHRGDYCFTHTTGDDVFLFRLQNAARTEVLVTNYGAIITSFKIKKQDGTVNDIVLGFDKVEDYLTAGYLRQYPWFGAAIGRHANRIKDAAFELNGKKYLLTKNEGNEQLHGGDGGFDRRAWQFAGQGTAPQSWLELTYKSPAGEEGFPGNLDVTIRFELNDKDELSYTYTATCDEPTVVNLTHHDYFNLDNGEGTIKEHAIKIHSDAVLEQDEQLVANGTISPVAGTAFDFREFTSIGDGLSKMQNPAGYDKSFVVERKENALVAEAKSLQSGLLLQVYSTEPVVHFYSGKWIPVIKGKNGTEYGPFSGFCLETQSHPNAVNIPHFPGNILNPGEIYHHKTVYKVNR